MVQPHFWWLHVRSERLARFPKAYDIKNTDFAILVQTGSIVETTIKSFKITNSNLSIWSLSLLNLLSASVTYQGITAIEQNGVLITNSGSVLPGLLTFSAARRIANTLSLPTVQFSSPYTSDLNAQLVTNADKKVRVRVITGYTESNGTQTPIYAGTGTATVKLTDDQGATQSGTTDSSGYVNFTLNYFPTAGATMTAQATTTYTSDPVTITVQDKTPPTPVTVKDGKIVADQKRLLAAPRRRLVTHFVTRLTGPPQLITTAMPSPQPLPVMGVGPLRCQPLN